MVRAQSYYPSTPMYRLNEVKPQEHGSRSCASTQERHENLGTRTLAPRPWLGHRRISQTHVDVDHGALVVVTASHTYTSILTPSHKQCLRWIPPVVPCFLFMLGNPPLSENYTRPLQLSRFGQDAGIRIRDEVVVRISGKLGAPYFDHYEFRCKCMSTFPLWDSCLARVRALGVRRAQCCPLVEWAPIVHREH
jgi:hypothetical protein